MDSHLILTCVAVDLICELLAGVGSNNALQQEAVVRWTKLLFGNVTESILQVIIHIYLLFFIVIRSTIIFMFNYEFHIITDCYFTNF